MATELAGRISAIPVHNALASASKADEPYCEKCDRYFSTGSALYHVCELGLVESLSNNSGALSIDQMRILGLSHMTYAQFAISLAPWKRSA